MKTQTALVLSNALGLSHDDVIECEGKVLEIEGEMCDSCRDFMTIHMENLQTVLCDDSISYASRLSYCLTTAAIMLSNTSHGTVDVSDVFRTLYEHAATVEATKEIQTIFSKLFGLGTDNNN